MGAEGFNDFYQGVPINTRVQREIDEAVRLFITVNLKESDPTPEIS